MKTCILCSVFLLAAGLSARAESEPLHYEVRFRDAVIATQTLRVAHAGDLATVSTSFAAQMRVFVAVHHYQEEVSVTMERDGTVRAFRSVVSDGPARTELTGTAGADDVLQVVRQGPEGSSTNFIARTDYDLNSLTLYGTAPEDFMPTNQPARALDLVEGKVVPVRLQTISESITFERQNLRTLHVIWTEGDRVSHSWHPERFSNLPSRYVRQSGHGEFVFTLLR